MGKRLDKIENWLNKFQIKTITIAVLVFFCLVFYLSPTSSAGMPPQVVKWIESNVYKVVVYKELLGTTQSGTAWWIDDQTLITNCHVVTGSDTAVIESFDQLFVLPVDVTTCDPIKDIAILKTKDGDRGQIEKTRVTPHAKPGDQIYSGGYTFGKGLNLNTGIYQHEIGNKRGFSIPTAPGDSGSPIIIIRDGEVYVVGMRQSVLMLNGGFGPPHLIAHMGRAVKALDIIKHHMTYNCEEDPKIVACNTSRIDAMAARIL